MITVNEKLALNIPGWLPSAIDPSFQELSSFGCPSSFLMEYRPRGWEYI
jgi:hypothetical protein